MEFNGRAKPTELERAIVVGIATAATPVREAKIHLEELAQLAHSAGAEVMEHVLQRRFRFDPGTLIGAGKLRELGQKVVEKDVGLILFDDDLTGSQVKKIESIIPKVKILDRSGLILDIFAKTAKTAEAKMQVEVAQLEYYLPRLTRAWTHLSRQVGGIGTRGPGETQLEVDRRLVRKRISDLKKRLKKIESIKRKQHERRYPTFHAALVGYTNAGKSSLMNTLTHSEVVVADKLFATLDATTRKLFLSPQSRAVLSDTVGFIRKLPHNLIESFKSTLSVVEEASLILHMVDASDPECERHMEVTESVLKSLDTGDIPRLLILNKRDLISDEAWGVLQNRFPDALGISVVEDLGIDALRQKISLMYERHLTQTNSEKKISAERTW